MLLSWTVSVRNWVRRGYELGEACGLEVHHLPPCLDRIRYRYIRVVNEIEVEVLYANLLERVV